MKAFGLPVIFLLLLLPVFAGYPQVKENLSDDAQADILRSWDFGKAAAGSILQHDFVLKNESGRTLKITGINTSCGCTVSKVKKEVLAPGETTEIEVKFNTRGYSGAVRQFIFVNTDSPENPIIRFTIKTEITK